MAIRVDRFLIDRAAKLVQERRRVDPDQVVAIEDAFIDLFSVDINFSSGLFRLACRPNPAESP